MSFDVKCRALAHSFLADAALFGTPSPMQVDDLAQIIQDAIEDYIADNGLGAKQ